MSLLGLIKKQPGEVSLKDLITDYEMLQNAIEDNKTKYEKNVKAIKTTVLKIEQKIVAVKSSAGSKANEIQQKINEKEELYRQFAVQAAEDHDEEGENKNDRLFKETLNEIAFLKAKMEALASVDAAKAAEKEISKVKDLHKESLIIAETIHELTSIIFTIIGQLRMKFKDCERELNNCPFHDTFSLSSKIAKSHFKPIYNLLDPTIQETTDINVDYVKAIKGVEWPEGTDHTLPHRHTEVLDEYSRRVYGETKGMSSAIVNKYRAKLKTDN